MKKIALVLLIATLTGCGSATVRYDKKTIDGVECVTGSTADGGVAVDCDWSR